MVLRKTMVTFTIKIPQMLANIPAPWILWVMDDQPDDLEVAHGYHRFETFRNLQTLPNTVCWTNFCCYCCLMNVSQSFTDTSHIVPRQVLFRVFQCFSSTSSRRNHVTQHDSTAAFCASRCRRAASRASSLCLHITEGLRGCQF